jgi:PhnB protein
MIAFLKRAFGARETERHLSPSGSIAHAAVRIGDSIVELGEAHGPFTPMPTTFSLHVRDSDALYRHALAAGGISVSEPADQPYGARVATIRDPFDNVWYLATPLPGADRQAR